MAVSLTKMTLRNEAYEIAAGEAGTDAAQYAGFGFGYGGNDTITGRAISNDFLYGGTGNDQVSGLAGDDFLFGQDGSDQLIGGAGIDALFGGRGNDWLDGGIGRDQLYGGLGYDTYVVDQTADSVRELVGEGVDTVLSTAQVYSLTRPGLEAQTQVEHLTFIGVGNFTGTGNGLANRITGGAGNDRLFGLVGQDSLIGGAGNDRLDGGAGRDFLTGGAGADQFVFAKTAGADRVMDFEDNVDALVLSGFAGVSTATQALSHAVQSGLNVVFNFGEGDVLTVLNTTKAALMDDLLVS